MGEVERPGVTRDVPCSRMRVARGNRGRQTMERRKFVIGLGALATGSAAAMGTGAFTAAEADRAVDVAVVNDAAGLLGIEAGLESDIVSGTNDGELEIAVPDDEGAGGLNDNSVYQLGEVAETPSELGPYDGSAWLSVGGDPTDEFAFSIVNQDTTSHDVSLEADFPQVTGGTYQPHFAVVVYDEANKEQDVGRAASGGQGPTLTVEDVSPGDAVYVALLFDTTSEGVDIDDGDLDGSLTISAD